MLRTLAYSWLKAAALGLLVLCACVLFTHAAHAAAPLTLSAHELRGDAMGSKLEWLEDPSGKLGIQDVSRGPASAQFRDSEADNPIFGLTTSAYWVRFTVQNLGQTPTSWLLQVAYPPLDDLRLYVPSGSGEFNVKRTGDHLPFASRDLPNRTFLFELEDAPGVRTYYLRVQTSGSLNLPLRAWTPETFLKHLTAEQPPLWVYYGLLLVMAAYNTFLFAAVRDRSYAYQVLFIVSVLFFNLSFDGIAFQHLWPTWTWFNGKALLLFIALSFGFGMRFQSTLLLTRERYPRLHTYSQVVVNGSFLLALASPFVPYAIGLRVLLLWGIHLMVFGLYSAFKAVYSGSRPALFYLAAWLILLSGLPVFILRTAGVLPDMWLTKWAVQICTSLSVTLTSLGLADAINVMRYQSQQLNSKLSDNVTELGRAVERAQAATRAKGEFLAAVSHELRAPLNAIINIPEGLLEDFRTDGAIKCKSCNSLFGLEAGEVPDYAQACPECAKTDVLEPHAAWIYTGNADTTASHLGHIHSASKHLLEVVTSILDFSKLEAGKMELQLSELDLGDLLHEAIEPMREPAASKGAPLILGRIPEGCRLRADRVKLRQAVINLVSNAIKFSDARGPVHINVQRDAQSYTIHVSDRGIGIAKQDIAHIFEGRRSLDSSEPRRKGGAGLGLSITKQFVELHGGRIWVDSELDKGSTFSIQLPKDGPGASEPVAAINVRAPQLARPEPS